MRNKRYGALLADPAWPWKARSQKGTGRGAVSHYNIMTMEEILALDPTIQALAADDAVLFLWALNSMLPQALRVIEGWGFEYKTEAFRWVKTTANGNFHFGLGYWTRQNTEGCFLATRGHPQRLDKISQDPAVIRRARSVPELLVSPKRQHDLIESLVPGPYVELFSRKSKPGWDVALSPEAGLLDHGPVETRRQPSSLVGL
jgi:N6-adenosine-specific RNA methylase IME4